jgi:hypothetical protein
MRITYNRENAALVQNNQSTFAASPDQIKLSNYPSYFLDIVFPEKSPVIETNSLPTVQAQTHQNTYFLLKKEKPFTGNYPYVKDSEGNILWTYLNPTITLHITDLPKGGIDDETIYRFHENVWNYFNTTEEGRSSQYLLAWDGTVLQCMKMEKTKEGVRWEQAKTTQLHNHDTVNIEAIGSPSTLNPEKQVESYIMLTKHLMELTGAQPNDIRAHRDFDPENRPNDPPIDLTQTIINVLNGNQKGGVGRYAGYDFSNLFTPEGKLKNVVLVSSISDLKKYSGLPTGFFVDAWNTPLDSYSRIQSIVNFAKNNNHQIIIAQVRLRGKAYYRGSPDTMAVTSFDPLGYLIEEAKKAGIDVYASVDIGWKSDDKKIDFTSEEDVEYALSLIRPLVENYPDLRGVNLDYVRYVDVPYVTDDMRDAVTNTVIKISELVRNGGKKITTTVVTWYPSPQKAGGFEKTRPYNEVGQNWKLWVEKGIVDTVIPMCYFSHGSYYETYRQWVKYIGELCEGRMQCMILIPDFMGVPDEVYAVDAANYGLPPLFYSFSSLTSN